MLGGDALCLDFFDSQCNCPQSQRAQNPSTLALALTSAFLLGSLPAATETERTKGLVAEALLGRRDNGGGRPVRLKSAHSGLPSGALLIALELFMVDSGP